MVIKFTSNTTKPPAMIYMGVDKVENEDLIKVWLEICKFVENIIHFFDFFSTVGQKTCGSTWTNSPVPTCTFGCRPA